MVVGRLQNFSSQPYLGCPCNLEHTQQAHAQMPMHLLSSCFHPTKLNLDLVHTHSSSLATSKPQPPSHSTQTDTHLVASSRLPHRPADPPPHVCRQGGWWHSRAPGFMCACVCAAPHSGAEDAAKAVTPGSHPQTTPVTHQYGGMRARAAEARGFGEGYTGKQ